MVKFALQALDGALRLQSSQIIVLFIKIILWKMAVFLFLPNRHLQDAP